MTADTRILTVYPNSWFDRPGVSRGRGKKHAFAWSGPVDEYGRAIRADGREHRRDVSFCGVVGDASGTEFKAREGDAITCSRCARKAAELEADLATHQEHSARDGRSWEERYGTA